VLSLMAAGLLIGAQFSFTWLWTLFLCLWITLTGWQQLAGKWAEAGPLTFQQYLSYTAFWWVIFGGTGGLVWFFARHLEQALRTARRQTAALSQTVEALAVEPDLDKFLGQALTVIAGQFSAQYISLFFYDPERDALALHMGYLEGRVFTAAEIGANGPPPITAQHSPLLQELIHNQQPLVITDPANDPRLINRALLQSQGVKVMLVVPLILREAVIGYLGLNSVSQRRYRAEELSLARSLSQQVTLAVQLTRLAEAGQRSAVLEERNRLAREIHDTLAQGFTGIVIQLEAAEDALGDSPRDSAAHLDRARALARTSLAEARRSVQALRPSALEHKRFLDALRDSIQTLTADAGLQTQIRLPAESPLLQPDTETELLRLTQEAVTNVLKHAQATELKVTLTFSANQLTLTIADNGRGLNPVQITEPGQGGFGLVGMRERVKRLGGELNIDGDPDRGTTVTIQSPISNLHFYPTS